MTTPLTMKAWIVDECCRRGVTPKTIRRRMQLGVYDHAIKIERKNARVVFVTVLGEPRLP